MTRNIFFGLAATLFLTQFLSAAGAPFEQVNKNFNRITSRVMIRKIAVPTLANLDYAAYGANPVRFDPAPQSPKQPAKKAALGEMTFGGSLINQCATLSQTPLTEAEKECPMAWDALQNKLWEITKSDAIARVVSKIVSWKWADESIFVPYQEIAAVYLHGQGDAAELWVKVEFKPWAKRVLDNSIGDEDKDGFPEIYGRLNLVSVDKAFLAKALEWMRNDYCKTLLTKEQVVDWANILASYWYPKLNTDVVDMTGQTKWPTPETEKDIIKELKGLTVDNPLVVIRGTPFGKKLFNVYLVDFEKQAAPVATSPVVASAAVSSQVASGLVGFDTTLSKNFIENNARFQTEIKTNGDYPAWAKKDEPFRRSVLLFANSLPAAQMGFKGKDGWLFFRGEASYLNSGDMSLQAPDKNPIPHLVEFGRFLKSKNISLIFVSVPNKSDLYFEKLPVDNPPKDIYEFVHPYARKMLSDIQASGIEVIDLLPAFLEAKKRDATNKEAVYQKHDTHWTDRGLETAAQIIGDRIKQFAWYAQVPKVKYTVKDTTFFRLGDLVDKLPESDKAAFQPDEISAKRVYSPDGTPYKGANADAPVMLIGDSFTGVFELVDCKSAGVGAHIAENTGIPIDIITSWGGGPLVRDKFYRARKNNLDKKRVVIYMMVSRDLYNYSQLWTPLEMK
jgi:alginate O-acetyltransferase complex protein AlgJ